MYGYNTRLAQGVISTPQTTRSYPYACGVRIFDHCSGSDHITEIAVVDVEWRPIEPRWRQRTLGMDTTALLNWWRLEEKLQYPSSYPYGYLLQPTNGKA